MYAIGHSGSEGFQIALAYFSGFFLKAQSQPCKFFLGSQADVDPKLIILSLQAIITLCYFMSRYQLIT